MALTALTSPLAAGRTAEVFAWGEGETQALKLFRPGWGMGAATHEAEVARMLYAAGVATPKVYEVIEVDGRPGIVYERVIGLPLLAMLSAPPWPLHKAARLLAETHANLHTRTVEGLPSLHEKLTRQIQAVPSLAPEVRRAALDALAALPGGVALCHGDYHPDNVLLSARKTLVIDWDNATCGDPLADVARTLLLMRASQMTLKTPAQRLLRRSLVAILNALYLRRYRQLHPFERARLAAWELPVTAARLYEGVKEEEVYLLARVRRLAAQYVGGGGAYGPGT